MSTRTRPLRKRWAFIVTAAAMLSLALPGVAAGSQTATYAVTIVNLTEGQPLTPPLLATHKKNVDLFDVGAAASSSIQALAENGDGSGLMSDLSIPAVADVIAAGAPLMPGSQVTLTIESHGGAKWLSYASMLICTNDGFTGLDGVRLPKRVGDSTVVTAAAYDAGTEINTEFLGDIVPPCQFLTPVMSNVEGTGMTNPALAEGGVITHHDGIAGPAAMNFLDPAVHGWDTGLPTVLVSITRTG